MPDYSIPARRTVRRPAVVAIPAKDEAADIGPCLQALAGQAEIRPDAVVICLNNCTDDSARIVADAAARLPFPLHCLTVALPPEHAFAATARKLAMDRAADLAGAAGIVLTTDADGRAAPHWLAANLAALSAGAEAVAGRAEIDPEGARLIPRHLHAADAEECAYAALLDEINALIDPDPSDPWPRHDEHCGASIAVTVAAYHRAGGMPLVRLGEDRAFFDALRRVDARIRHARDAAVVVSARTMGRAAGGMADTMRRRMTRMDPHLDDRLEAVGDAVRRATLRARLRVAWRGRHVQDEILAASLGLPSAKIGSLVSARYFGAAWAEVEAASPLLRRRKLPVSMLPAQMLLAQSQRDMLVNLAADLDDSAFPAAVA